MERMFYSCTNLLQLDLLYFDTDKVNNMTLMFYYCNNLTKLSMNSLNTINVEAMNSMFRECHSLTMADLTNVNTKNVINMNYMFYNCKELTKIYVGQLWTTEKVDNSNYMFSYDTKLVGGNGTLFNTAKTNQEYARIDGGPNSATPGYFTLKP